MFLKKNPLRRYAIRYAITAGALLISAAIFARVSWGRVRSEVSNPPVLTFKNHPKNADKLETWKERGKIIYTILETLFHIFGGCCKPSL